TRLVLDASGAELDWKIVPAGAEAAEQYGAFLPRLTLDAIREAGVALKGPITTPVGRGHTSVNVALRKGLDLYAAVRPVRSMPGIKTRYENVDIVVIRENTEGLYSGIENEIVPGVVQSLKITTRKACERIARFAFNYACERGRKRITVFHKANILKMADGLFLDCSREVHRQDKHGVDYDEMIIDNGCMQIVRDPTRFDMLLLENFYGDFISDLCAGLVGGLGVVPGANIGDDCAVFEAVHGSAPDLAGKNVANPLALIMSGVMMLRFLGETSPAERIRTAYDAVLEDGRKDELTRDLGGSATTNEFAKAVIRRLNGG
ncbi:MAG: isocitrate/isopropylmalate dehydrogenase family protein, partial [Candidatus Hydrogenedentota bacterium]